jgi:hypothetical protein
MMVQQPEAKSVGLVMWGRKTKTDLMEIDPEGAFLPH